MKLSKSEWVQRGTPQTQEKTIQDLIQLGDGYHQNYTLMQVLEVKTSTMNQGMLASTTRVSYKTHRCRLPKQPHTMAQVSKLWAFPHHSIQRFWRWFPDHMASTHIENSPLCKIGGCPVRASVLGHGEATCGGRRLRPVLASALEARVSLLTRINFKEGVNPLCSIH